jgi:hypothetical protein
VGVFLLYKIFIIKYIMKNIINEELGRMKNLFGYKRGIVISEQAATLPPSNAANFPTKIPAAQPATQAPNSFEVAKKIANELNTAVMYPGDTNEKKFVDAIKMIKTPQELRVVNNIFKGLGKKMDIATVINDELGINYFQYVKSIVDHLKSIGVSVDSNLGPGKDNRDYFGGFKITYPAAPVKTPVTTAPVTPATPKNGVVAPVKTPAVVVTTPKELKDADGIKKFQDWLDVNVPGWATGYQGGILNKGNGYGRFGKRTQTAWKSYSSFYIKSLAAPAPVAPVAPAAQTPGVETKFTDNRASYNNAFAPVPKAP